LNKYVYLKKVLEHNNGTFFSVSFIMGQLPSWTLIRVGKSILLFYHQNPSLDKVMAPGMKKSIVEHKFVGLEVN
jgi:hypothetical protein